ncbi:YceD family protein [Loktanella sp. Alg231-35]|uniref:YceD family protein n=1 Tax=Loktanella sp. Alg231-35 TaxID=1922220 RepID=UPI001F1DB6AE|nr:DUF177 domain-containing protein [Loktanella sp. Alg231-35]
MSDLATRKATTFAVEPTADERKAVAAELGIIGIKKLRFVGTLAPQGKTDWQLQAILGATVVQACVVTLDPVTTRIDEPLNRAYIAEVEEPDASEVEMTADENREPLPATLDLAQVMIEALALALPLYPRAANANLGEAVFAAPGVAPMRDEDAKPFAGLQSLRESLEKKGE